MGVQKNKKMTIRSSQKVRKADKFRKTKPEVDVNFENFNYEDFNKLQPQKWYVDFPEGILQTDIEIKLEELEKLRKEARTAMDESVAMHNTNTPKSISSSDYSWIKTILSKGTKNDKIAAYTILIQDSPICSLNFLNNLIGMVKVGKKEWTLAAETLQELFLNDLLPPDRKLILFSQRPLHELYKISSGNESKRKNLLLHWFFENQLKLVYRDFIVALNAVAHDSVDANKEKAIVIMCKLLEKNPEQESALLSNIVNKLGDPSHKVGSKVIYALTRLLQVHPNMRQVVMEEVEKLVFRPNINKRAQYYSICFLMQFCLTSEDSGLAKKLISIYLSIFKACIKMGDIDSRMMRALLTGVNRAYPFAKENSGILGEQINTIYKVVHIGKPNVSIQALSLLYLVSRESSSISDRFFMVLYKKVSEISLYNSTHHAMFLNLIYKALKKDRSHDRVAAFVKRLLQVSLYLPPPLACGTLFIISEVMAEKKNIMILQQTMNNKREMNKHFYDSDDNGDDGNEYYEDVDLESKPDDASVVKKKCDTVFDPASMKHNFLLKDDNNIQQTNLLQSRVWQNPIRAPEDKEIDSEYDPFCRNPLFSNGKQSVAVELRNLAHHYHPSVSLFANKILNGERISYSGDPLQDFALIRFLDKFSFKNPKKEKISITEKETFKTFGKRKLYNQSIVQRLKVNTKKYLKQNERDVPPDEKFIYSYFKGKECTSQEEKDDESDVDSVGSDEFQEMLHKMTGFKEDDDDIDFLNEAGQLARKDKKLDDKEEEDSQDEGEISDEGSYALDFEGSEIDDFSDDLLEGSELDESEIPSELKHLNFNAKGNKKNLKSKDQFSKKNLFASAEEFAEILEDTNYKDGGSEAVSNRENADVKQLKWEDERVKKYKRNIFKNSSAKGSKFYGKSGPRTKKKKKNKCL